MVSGTWMASLVASLVALVQVVSCEQTLWDRMGGMEKIKPLVSDVYDRHASDPLSAPWFGPNKYDNNGNADFVKNHILGFLSAGIGGPLEYTGRSMIDAHKGMDIPLDAFHAIIFHMVEQMEKHGAGNADDRHTISTILRSLEADVRGDRYEREQEKVEAPTENANKSEL